MIDNCTSIEVFYWEIIALKVNKHLSYTFLNDHHIKRTVPSLLNNAGLLEVLLFKVENKEIFIIIRKCTEIGHLHEAIHHELAIRVIVLFHDVLFHLNLKFRILLADFFEFRERQSGKSGIVF